MICTSRRDDNDKKLFVQESRIYKRWNLYSQIAIENDTLKCVKEAHNLTDLCTDKLPNQSTNRLQPCTLLNTYEVVDIGFDAYIL